MKVKDRHELYNKFNDIMNSVYVSRKDEKKQNFNQNMIKTYMIEGHINDSNNPTHDDFLKFFRQNFENNYEIEVEETEKKKNFNPEKFKGIMHLNKEEVEKELEDMRRDWERL